ncbi:MAG: antitoxin [Myxococcales bacterium]|nr:antitoxin [Myxococcales bacterium]
MRTTVTLDPDVARFLHEEAHRTRRGFKAVLNDYLRRGIRGGRKAEGGPFKVSPHRTKLVPGVDPARLNHLVDELEDEALLARQARR